LEPGSGGGDAQKGGKGVREFGGKNRTRKRRSKRGGSPLEAHKVSPPESTHKLPRNIK